MKNGTAKKFVHAHCGSRWLVLPGLMAGQNRHLPPAERLGLDCRALCRGCCRSGRYTPIPSLQRHTLLNAPVPTHRTLPKTNGGWI